MDALCTAVAAKWAHTNLGCQMHPSKRNEAAAAEAQRMQTQELLQENGTQIQSETCSNKSFAESA